jgi:hypothetical protein
MTIYTITIAVSVLLFIAIGSYAGRRVRDIDDYFVAGRRAPSLLIVGTLVASVFSTSIFLGEAGFTYDGQLGPYLLLPVSDETPYAGSYYLVRPVGGQWRKTPITRTAHPFNASYLDRLPDGRYRAVLVSGGAHADSSQENMDQYGWGDSVEVWTSGPDGEDWRRSEDLTPVTGRRYQNVQFVSADLKAPVDGLLLFYGWDSADEPGTGYLWDAR